MIKVITLVMAALSIYSHQETTQRLKMPSCLALLKMIIMLSLIIIIIIPSEEAITRVLINLPIIIIMMTLFKVEITT